MERIQRIFRHPLYREHFQKLQEAEKDRIFCRHDLQHFLDVARISYIYDMEDGGNTPKAMIYAAALLHDIGRYTEIAQGRPHNEAGAELAQAILADCGFERRDIEAIARAILGHRDSSHEAGREEDKLSRYIRRADKAARCCFACGAAAECKWSEEKKNHAISV